MLKWIFGLALGKKLIAAIAGIGMLLFIALPIWLSGGSRGSKPFFERRERQTCPCCGQVIRDGLFHR